MSEELSPASTLGRLPGLQFELSQPSARRKISLASRVASLIPYIVVWFAWLFAAFAVTVVAWFAILITGRYPSGLFAFNARAWRFLVRTNSYAFLLVDVGPPFSGGKDLAYPLQVDITPLPQYNRVLTLLRFPALIPLSIVTLAATLMAYIAWVPSLLSITLFRHQPASLQKAIAFYMRTWAGFISSVFLLTEILWVA